MPKRSHDTTTTRPKPRRRGGQELPDELQDRPEQNAGYDAAVRGEGTGTPIESHDDSEVDDLESGRTDVKLREE
ncbi:MAG TPA: hypothetical protein VFO19_21495 [Vicinamibacterales bacterium]|jgi:hypothetical protein|nr:hypothetical protein [Vicinamibacterales bacterium]